MRQIEDMGGAVAAIERGFQKAEIERSAYAVAAADRLRRARGRRASTGSRVDEEEHYEPLRVDPAIGDEQCARLAALRAERDQDAVDAALEAVKAAARGTDNVLYPLRDALRARATVGEVSDALREVWGLYTPADVF